MVSMLLLVSGAVGALLTLVGATTAPAGAALVVTLIIAVFLTAVLRIVRAVPDIRRESAATARAVANVQAVKPGDDTLVGRRLRLFREAAEAGNDCEAVLSARSALDDSEMANKHHLDHALIWALPVFGFIGTALTMAGMVTSFSDALDDQGDPSVLIDALKQHVLPELASAFGVTLIALFLSVVAFGAMALVERAERASVVAADDVFLIYIARLPAKQAAPAMQGLTQELAQSRQEMAQTRGRTEELVKGLDALRTAVERLSAAETRPQKYTLVREP
ncbi:hypothetical protein FE391_41650 [Nonomuraea sp. KC401]|uniref:MotA/TolQ/ExbB proton channel domain-containing protein n=1 Tax=Nonomuraea longispora TaxID=1848320 RepID=A0A4R4MP68_9ACTN|nr:MULTISPECIES: hypothetical protein [Nonomuraea]NBE96042.1 hypothetical protein [Nonomuraea sp. K271]TDB97800.1 hypothetical protein E1267_39455 [Nonomuraea longispora]TLF54563.1 hypothetical protein FE391_41650 [Nonomuraea sp. KC401]